MAEFVFMLTVDDKTVPDARAILDTVHQAGLNFVGFKDIGVPKDELRRLAADIRQRGAKSMLEVVSLTEEDELNSARMALEFEVDYLVGGTRHEAVSAIIAGSGIGYWPYVGTVVDHPAKLKGDESEIVAQAIQAVADGVEGVNLLAYRHVSLDPVALAAAVKRAVAVPVMCAGGVDTLEKVGALVGAGVWGFTIGSAVVRQELVDGDHREQISAVLRTLAKSPATSAV